MSREVGGHPLDTRWAESGSCDARAGRLGVVPRGERHEFFERGNTFARRHGARHEATVAPLAAEIEAELAALAPWARREMFAPARRRYARAEAVAELLWRYLVEHGPVDDEGNPRPALGALSRWEATAANRAADLGLSPSAFAKLTATLAAVDQPDAREVLATLAAAGRKALEARAGGDAA